MNSHYSNIGWVFRIFHWLLEYSKNLFEYFNQTLHLNQYIIPLIVIRTLRNLMKSNYSNIGWIFRTYHSFELSELFEYSYYRTYNESRNIEIFFSNILISRIIHYLTYRYHNFPLSNDFELFEYCVSYSNISFIWIIVISLIFDY